MNDPQDPTQQNSAAQQGDQGAQPSGAQPSGAQPSGAQPPAGQAGQKDLSGIMEENVDVSGLVANAGQNQQASQALLSIPIPAHPNTKFDEKKFLELLAGSISLTINEKKKIIEAIPQLSQFQIDELMKIFEEEKGKFAELEKKHADQIADLEKQHAGAWQDLEAQKEEEAKKQAEVQQAEDIKKQLGLG
ncbi:hypothetical protein KJ657_00660 [Patescibacteria group bacterium]|nr:hypothetical protein [Patescibacteria group bacterium]MBU1685535.1 hypothetical protein [Patescibacteria group bacterium]MBU1938290.1 hypothetical protein [Patescibacteria group bacterium]